MAFELRGLPVGVHHGRLRISADDGLAIDNTRYFTVDVHDPWPVLLATSDGAVARYVAIRTRFVKEARVPIGTLGAL